MSGFKAGDMVCVSGPESQDIGRTGIVLGNWSIVDLGGSEGQKWFPTNWLVPANSQIDLPLAIVPSKWWVAKDIGVYVYEYKPQIEGDYWRATCGDTYCIPPWIAAQLPQEWHALPWDQSAMRQTEGGEG